MATCSPIAPTRRAARSKPRSPPGPPPTTTSAIKSSGRSRACATSPCTSATSRSRRRVIDDMFARCERSLVGRLPTFRLQWWFDAAAWWSARALYARRAGDERAAQRHLGRARDFGRRLAALDIPLGSFHRPDCARHRGARRRRRRHRGAPVHRRRPRRDAPLRQPRADGAAPPRPGDGQRRRPRARRRSGRDAAQLGAVAPDA